jgi:hypothetical protein
MFPRPESAGGFVIGSFLRFRPDQNVFGFRWLLSSSGFYSEQTSLYRREKCGVGLVPLPSDPPVFDTSTPRTGYRLGTYDVLRCVEGELFRFRYGTHWMPGLTPEYVSTVSTWQYAYGKGVLSATGVPTIEAELPELFVPPGQDCFFDPQSLRM